MKFYLPVLLCIFLFLLLLLFPSASFAQQNTCTQNITLDHCGSCNTTDECGNTWKVCTYVGTDSVTGSPCSYSQSEPCVTPLIQCPSVTVQTWVAETGTQSITIPSGQKVHIAWTSGNALSCTASWNRT